ncbi:hypothetical protein D9615_006073 [Tricholomella constricta]|uniref:Uncharacterized protein n=1 Tax=Tricholomella constricta TaxID=117010 RepID=A0A8H5M363_9AGAR|nr:hypothetical protein D9615_006073 [Tricholomella constricta]
MQHSFLTCTTLAPLVMKTTGTGSKHSPIAIYDSEDEVLQELVGEGSFDPNPPFHNRLPGTDQREKLSRNWAMSTERGKGNSKLSDLEGKRPQKRKRVTDDSQGVPLAGPSQSLHNLPNHSPAVMSKKAKKRRRKLERQVMEVEAHPPRHQAWAKGTKYLVTDSTSSPMLPSRQAIGGGYSKTYLQPEISRPFSPYSVMYPPTQHAAESPAASSSAWVASMAMAAEAPAQVRPKDWESYPNWVDPLERIPPRPGFNAHNLPTQWHLPQRPAESASLPPLAPAPALIQAIGMKPEHDPSSKHGLYQIPPASSLSKGEAAPYIPNPARTLVMEQLPKSHRTTDFVNSWSKSACGAYPVYTSIDPPAAKALVEFATAELARKAWGSPRLGAALVGLKTHQLKGRPREDLIKVWWYRVHGVGANAGVGEIEEGEIQGDAAEKEVEVPVKKETKKERKARLAKERQAKQAALPKPKTAAPPIQSPSQAAAALLPDLSRIPTTASSPFPLPSNPADSRIEHQTLYSYYPTTPPAHSHPAQHHLLTSAPVLPSQQASPHRVPLLPQSALETQWRLKHELPKKPTAMPYTPSASRSTPFQDGYIASSIASSKSPSPVQISSHLTEPQPSTPTHHTSSAAYEDMDVDDDMELESPQTGKLAHIDTPLPAPITDYAATATASTPIPVAFVPIPATKHHDDMNGTQPIFATAKSCDTTTATTSTASVFELDPIPPPATINSPTLSATPPLEPRAMKNAPKGPSFAKRSLMARHKELEDRIARSKMELSLIRTTAMPISTIDRSIPIAASPVSTNDDLDKQAMEDRLRSLVLRSQKHRMRSSASASTSATSTDPPSISQSSASSTPSSTVTVLSPEFPSSAVSSVSSHSFSWDNLAVSFITETIETIKATPPPTLPPAPTAKPYQSNSTSATTTTTKLELAAKQRRLEAQIAESKILMAKLGQAQTKQERESILAVMRERSRCVFVSLPPFRVGVGSALWRRGMMMEHDGAATNTSTPTPSQGQPKPPQVHPQPSMNAGYTQTRQTQVAKTWVGSHEHTGVFIVSDDEEDDDRDCDDAA